MIWNREVVRVPESLRCSLLSTSWWVVVVDAVALGPAKVVQTYKHPPYKKVYEVVRKLVPSSRLWMLWDRVSRH